MMNKRMLSLLLAVVLVIGLMPTSVFATENAAPTETSAPAESVPETTGEAVAPIGDDGEGEPEPSTEAPTDPAPGTEAPSDPAPVWCELCQVNDCGQEHKQCPLCGTWDCDGEHEYCKICEKYDCGEKHGIPCMRCGVTDCGIDHDAKPTEPTEPEATEPEETTEPSEGEEILCDQCDATKDEEGNVVHEEDCATLCTCEPVDGVHQEDCVFFVGTDNEIFSGPAKNFTNVAPLVKTPAAERVPMFATWGLRDTPARVDNAHIETAKSATDNEDGTYTLKLESYVTGKTVTTETEEVTPADIVLVLDMTASMEICMQCGYKFGYFNSVTTKGCTNCVKRIDAMRSAVASFLDKVEEQSNVDHRVSVVTFADNANYYYAYDYYKHYEGNGTSKVYSYSYVGNATGILYDNGNAHLTYKTYNQGSGITNQQYGNSLIQLNTLDNCGNSNCPLRGKSYREQINDYLSIKTQNAQHRIPVAGATYSGHGMAMAEKVFAQLSQEELANRDQIVVFLSDGIPTKTSDDTAGKAVQAAGNCIKNYGATIYTVGIFSGADGSNPTDLESHNNMQSDYGNDSPDTVDTANTFMHLVSSNYPNATGTQDNKRGSLADLEDGEGYYLTAADAGNLTQIFNKIADQITSGGSNIKLDSTTEVKDIVTDSFVIPDNASAVRAYTMTYDGNNDDGTKKWKSENESTFVPVVSGRNVTVSGFNFSDNYVGLDQTTSAGGQTTYTPHGKKLVIEVDIKPNDDFLGGDFVSTNDSDSGIYSNGVLLEAFETPDVSIEVSEITPLWVSKDIYLSQTASLPEVIKLGEYNQNSSDWMVNGINNAYVDIEYTVMEKDKPETAMTYVIPAGTAYENLTDIGWSEDAVTHPLLKGDTTYTVTCKVSSVGNPSGNNKQKSVEAEVKVYKPIITFKDSAINLGETPDYATQNLVSMAWMHGETEANAEVMGVAPALEYTYDPAAAEFTEKTNVKVTVTAKSNGTNVPLDQDITQYVNFYRNKCEAENGCDFAGGEVTATDPNRINFVVHIKTFDLTIIKAGVNTTLDGNAPFVFQVKSEETGVDMQVVIYGNDSVTIKGLPAGTYTVTEVNGYWRYEVTKAKPKQSQDVTPSGSSASVTFTNERTKHNWLDDWASATNNFS